ncbi:MULTISPECIES: hypothetical protein [unclassified Meiothermus]|uniref:hypothetical protein n=1 Tax=unclassified Meiothermus TaxID=370471 RepID=UPI000D7BE4DB|nr:MULTISPECIES: hypothetical protein [unclassified Meiothermus]PZA05809.1 hypothetical protein DNA98_16765 [Meiothermus sp. Pnk-1]RYM29961.1 hypothetical protein EWH23_15840 [Meiothermus sp. PNK-Is4]
MYKPKPWENNQKQLHLNLRAQLFEIPPLWDALLIGCRAPIGPEAARRMAESLSPGQYELIPLEGPVVEACLVRKKLLQLVESESLLRVLLEECAQMLDEETVIRVHLDLELQARHTLRLK